MTTTNRPLTLEEQAKLWIIMRTKKITQTAIAKANHFTNSAFIRKVCYGEYNVTPRVIRQFKKAGINLNEVMGNE